MTTQDKWALVLGASSGFGASCSIELARHGINIIGVHLDRKGTLAEVDNVIKSIKETGRQALFFNANAADAANRAEVLEAVYPKINGRGQITVVLHSLAFGNLKPYIGNDPKECLTQRQLEMTLDVMANSLVYWVQELFFRKLIGQGSRIFAMTSSGGRRVWPNYGAVSAAKAALESHIRQIAMEMAPFGITANTIRAGVTDTPALRKIPGNEQMVELAKLKNPHHRLTTTKDVAKAIAVLSSSATQWMTGNVIGIDGGEDIVG
jgi:enoyl-[acyl-carrier protein] reductase III